MLCLLSKNCFPVLFYIICGSATKPALHPLVHRVLDSSGWPFVHVKNHQVRFRLTKANQVKPIFKSITQKTILCVVRCVLQRFKFVSRTFYLIHFVDTAFTVRDCLRKTKKTKLFKIFFKDIMFGCFCSDKLIRFSNNNISLPIYDLSRYLWKRLTFEHSRVSNNPLLAIFRPWRP